MSTNKNLNVLVVGEVSAYSDVLNTSTNETEVSSDVLKDWVDELNEQEQTLAKIADYDLDTIDEHINALEREVESQIIVEEEIECEAVVSEVTIPVQERREKLKSDELWLTKVVEEARDLSLSLRFLGHLIESLRIAKEELKTR